MKTLVQTSHTPQPEYVTNMLRAKLPDGWDYRFFTDDDILAFFEDHPIDFFNHVSSFFKSLQYGAHKADVFRLYFLYVHGGAYLDSDAMLEVPIDQIAKDYSFVTVLSGCEPSSVFNGFLIAEKGHPVIYEALKYLSITSTKVMNRNYFLPCDNLFSIVSQPRFQDNICLLNERIVGNRWETYDETGTVVLNHYPYTKHIPPPATTGFRFHIPGIHYTITSKEYSWCPFTQQILNFCKMMTERGHTVFHYGHKDSNPVCTEHVPIACEPFRNYKASRDFQNSPSEEFNKHVIEAITKRKQDGDFVLAFWGQGHKAICDAFPEMLAVEPSVGYKYPFANYRAYTSYAFLHTNCEDAGCQMPFYHWVIPCTFDLNEFSVSEEKEDYFLFVGRLNYDKGFELAIQVTQAIGAKLIIAGQGVRDLSWPSHVEFAGYLDVEARRKIMSKAKGVFTMTLYMEPFGCTAVESLLCGTPVISTDWGGFSETVIHGVNGFRCRTFEQMIWAAQNVHTLDPHKCAAIARERYSIERIYDMYNEFFTAVHNIKFKNGFYTLNSERTDLNFLNNTR